MATTTPSGLLVWRRNLEPSSRRWTIWVAVGIAALAGFGLTPQAFATAPIATQSKTPMVAKLRT